MTRFDQIEHACLTDAGVRRYHNQDSHAIALACDEDSWRQRGHLFLVADGMGAAGVGEQASGQAADIIPRIYQEHAQQGAPQALCRAFGEANASIHKYATETSELAGMGTTSTALLLRPDGAWVGHVGDSRCYRIRNEVIEQLSYDHSIVWEYARLQHMDPDEVENIPRNVIHRCLGPEPQVQVDVEGPHTILPGDVYLLCSDGLSGQISDQELGAVASVLPPAEACPFLVELSKMRGGPDNITAIIVRVAEPPTAGAEDASRPRGRKPLPARARSLLTQVGRFLLPPNPTPHPPARVHRRRACKVEQPLLDKLIHALGTLRKRVWEKTWNVDWEQCEEHKTLADNLLARNDLAGAFREYCRAMLPLMPLYYPPV